jgi:ribose 5-phosphate isomerase B
METDFDYNKIVVLASDHNGVDEKTMLVEHLQDTGYYPIDLGPHTKAQSVDYVDYASQAAIIVSRGQATRGILICGTGVGMSIVANRFKQVRAVLAHNPQTAVKSREHNNSNVLCLGSWVNSIGEQTSLVDLWLKERWGEGRHVKRVERIDSKQGIVLANGVFDLIHRGHLELLKFARSQGSHLVVAIDSDERVRRIKGPKRPINKQEDRKRLLENNRYVDEVVVFDSDNDLQDLYRTIDPSVVVKGGEWDQEQIRKRDRIPDDIVIKIFPIVQSYSTTQTLAEISGDPEKWAKSTS